MQYSRFVHPAGANTVLEIETLETCNIVSYHFSYKDSDPCLNLLSSSAGQKYLPVRLPLSYFRLATVGGAIGVVLVIAIWAIQSLV